MDYAYDGANIVLVFDGTGAVTGRYLQMQTMDQTLVEETPGEVTRWLLPDHQGTVRDVVDGGTAQTHLTYDSFGQILAITGSFLPTPRFTYTGREWDADAQLFYYRARWYDPATGRFLSQDPIGFRAGDGNLYRYVGNSPPGYTDPTGHDAQDTGFFDWFSRMMMGDDPAANAWLDGAIKTVNGTAEDIKQLMRVPAELAGSMGRLFMEEGNAYAEDGNVPAATLAYMAAKTSSLLQGIAQTAADPNSTIAAMADRVSLAYDKVYESTGSSIQATVAATAYPSSLPLLPPLPRCSNPPP